MTFSDFAKVCDAIQARYLDRFAGMGEDELGRVRGNFVYRLTRTERNRMIVQDGKEGTPNQNLRASSESIWDEAAEKQLKEANAKKGLAGVCANVDDLLDRVPWKLWLVPLVM